MPVVGGTIGLKPVETIMAEEDDGPKRKPVHELGQILDELSVKELEERIVALRIEIERLQFAMAGKQGALTAAASFFATPTTTR